MPELNLPNPPERQESRLPPVPTELELPPGGELEAHESGTTIPEVQSADLGNSGPENDSGLVGILFPLILVLLAVYFFGPTSWRTYLVAAKDNVLEEVKIIASRLQTEKLSPAPKSTQVNPSPGLSQASGSGLPIVGSSELSGTPTIQGSMRLYRIDEAPGRRMATLELNAQSTSGTVMEVLVWTDVTPRGIWQPFAQYITAPIDNATTVSVKFEDEQGNLSPIYSATITPPPPTNRSAE